MNINVHLLGSNEVLSFARGELIDYLKTIFSDVFLAEEAINAAYKIELSCGNEEYDGYSIKADCMGLKIVGENPRSTLFGVYRFLEELGFAFPAPGITIEPKDYPKTLSSISLDIKSKPSYKHRGIVIEGANSIENVRSMISWMPKLGFNTYFLQFDIPFTFFSKWYRHEENPGLKAEPFTIEDALRFKTEIESEVKKRGLILHSVGHGWTTKALGGDAIGWDKEETCKFDVEKTALIKGKRGLFEGIAINTNLCYSSAENIGILVRVITEYAKEHSNTDVLHVWFADAYNNFCECEKCKNELPSDQYVHILNEIDKSFEKEGIKTRICFLIYYDLLWPPKKERLRNPERFVMMFAPITRTFESSYLEIKEKNSYAKYEKNKISPPSSIEENIAFLRAWQKDFHCDSFDFDYHLGRAHYGDPGYEKISRIISEDVKALRKLGLNGLLSCQEQRAAFPTALPDYVMGKTLWNENLLFDEIADEYYSVSFGLDDAGVRELRRILSKISDSFSMDYFNGQDKDTTALSIALSEINTSCDEAERVIKDNLERSDLLKGQRTMWKRLSYLPRYVRLFASCFLDKINERNGSVSYKAFAFYVMRNEMELQEALDAYRLLKLSREVAGFIQ